MQIVTHKKKQSNGHSISQCVAKKSDNSNNNNNNNNNNNKIKQETKATVKVKIIKKLCA